MKIFRNIPCAVKLYYSLKYLNSYKKEIDKAKAEGDDKREQEYILKATRVWGSKVMEMFGAKVNVTGKENLLTEGPVVYVANHQGYADIIACCAVLDTVQFGFIAKNDLDRIPVYGTWIKRIRSIPFSRGDVRQSLRDIDRGIELIERGFSLLIFPEGTRSKGPAMGEFKKGSLKLATKPGVPVIPITLNGTYRMYEETGVIRGAEFDLVIHPAIETKNLNRQEAKSLSDDVEALIGDTLSTLQSAR